MINPARTRIKICGVRDLDTALAAVDAGADAIGFVFHLDSPRFIRPEAAWEIIQQLPPFVTTVGLTVSLNVEEFAAIEEQCPTDFNQLHGEESIETVRRCGPRIIKAIRFQESTIEAELARWSALDEVDALLIDGSAGGMGTAFDWARLAPLVASCPKRIILAGGLTPENVAGAIAEAHPYAVDVSSGVECERGVKDAVRIQQFCQAVRSSELRPN